MSCFLGPCSFFPVPRSALPMDAWDAQSACAVPKFAARPGFFLSARPCWSQLFFPRGQGLRDLTCTPLCSAASSLCLVTARPPGAAGTVSLPHPEPAGPWRPARVTGTLVICGDRFPLVRSPLPLSSFAAGLSFNRHFSRYLTVLFPESGSPASQVPLSPAGPLRRRSPGSAASASAGRTQARDGRPHPCSGDQPWE